MIGSFEILFPLYHSEQITFYRAINSITKQPYTLKTPSHESPSLREIASLEHEFHLLRRFSTPQIIQAHALIREENHIYLVLEEIEGFTLQEFIHKEGSLNLKLFFKIAVQLVEILEKIHEHKIIHKDLQPSNVLIDPKTLAIKIIDFRQASEFLVESTTPTQVDGKPTYFSPEQTGRTHRLVDFRSDFYSLGVTFYKMISGHLPFESQNSLELIFSHLRQPLPKLPLTIPPILENLIFKLMAKAPEDRYKSAFGIRSDLIKISQNKTNFELGSDDLKAALFISQKLYGREKPLEKLLNCFKDFQETELNHLMLVQAPDGMGKSALIQEAQKLFPKGRFIKGKFDPAHQLTPFFGLSQAIKELMQQILTDKENLDFIKEELKINLHATGRIIADLDPNVEVLAGPFPPLEHLPNKEARIRLLYTFQNFFKIFAKKEEPLIVFLDDLQWADQASLDVISFLLEKVPYLFMIHAFNGNERSSNLYRDMLQAVKRQVIISLSPLSKKEINALLKDTLGKEKVDGLADFLLNQSSGNPFFIIELIKTLYEQGLIFFSGKEWSFNLASIKEIKSMDNLVNLLISKLHKLSSSERKVLSLAACLGSIFELKELSIIAECNQKDLNAILWKVIQEEFVISNGSDYELAKIGAENIFFRFSHDKVQEAAYLLIPEQERKAIHLQIGRLLLQHTKDQNLLFDIINHYNRSLDLVIDLQEKKKAAEFNLEAARKAKASNAYQASLSFYEATRTLLEKEDFWIEKEYAECLYFVGSYKESEEKLNQLIQKAQTRYEKISIYFLLTLQNCNLGQFKKAIKEGCKGLQLFKIYVSENPSNFDAFCNILYFKLRTSLISTTTLKNSPLMQDAELILVGQIFEIFTIVSYVYSPNLFVISSLKSILLGIDHGVSSGRAFGIAIYILILMIQHRFKEALKWREVAYCDAEKLQNSLLLGKLNFIDAICVYPWFSPWKEVMPLFKKADRLGYECGDPIFLTIVHNSMAILSHIIGNSITDTKEECQKLISVLMENQAAGYADYAYLFQSLLNSLQEEEKWEDEMNKYWQNTQDHPFNNTAKRYTSALVCGYYFIQGDFRKSWDAAQKSALYVQGTFSHVSINSLNNYFTALAGFALYPSLSKKEKQAVKRAYQEIKFFYKKYPPNHAASYLHLSAEIAALKGKVSQAAQLFDQALDDAEQRGCFHYAAVIAEGTFRFYTKNNQPRMARTYLQIAYYYYNRWGAFAKAKQLEKRYSQWLSAYSLGLPMAASSISSQSSSTHAVDFLSTLEAVQTLASKIRFEDFLSQLVRIAQENTAAEKAILILNEEDQLIVKAVGQKDKDLQTHLISIPLSQYPHLPQTIVNYVFHTKKGLILNNANKEGDFCRDDYVLKQQLKSVICYPLRFKNELNGIIYLEKNTISNAFKQDHLDFIYMFSSQAAISLQNSRFYEELQNLNTNLERLTKERTKELENALDKLTLMQKQLFQQEKVATLGLITAGVAHEIKNPLNSIINFSDISKEYLEEIKDFINEHKDACTPEELEAITSSLGFLQLNTERIYSQGQRIDSIVRRMSEHAKGRSGQVIVIDVYKFLDESIDLFQEQLKVRKDPWNIAVQKDFDSPFQLLAISSSDMYSVILNLLNNAYYAINVKKKNLGESYIPCIQVITKNLENTFEIHVKDNGIGIAEELLDKIFVPFTTTKAAGEGTGLGLSLSNEIVRAQHNGSLTFTSKEGEFTEFVITLPKPKQGS